MQTTVATQSAGDVYLSTSARVGQRSWRDLLRIAELDFPHTFGLVVPEDKDEPRPWVVSADDASERAVGLAFRRASRHLHPDRLSQRDVSVRVEAEEVLKVLGAAFDDVATWHSDGKTSTPVTATTSNSATECGVARGASTSCANGGTDLRDGIFNDDMAPVRSSSDTAHSTATVQRRRSPQAAAASSSGAAGGVTSATLSLETLQRRASSRRESSIAYCRAAGRGSREAHGLFSRGKKKDKSKGSVTAMKAKSKAKENQDNPFGPTPVSVGGKSSLGPGNCFHALRRAGWGSIVKPCIERLALGGRRPFRQRGCVQEAAVAALPRVGRPQGRRGSAI